MKFVVKLSAFAFIAVATSAVALFEVTGLDHKILNHSMEDCAVIIAVRSKKCEVFNCFGSRFIEQPSLDYAFGSFNDGYFIATLRFIG